MERRAAEARLPENVPGEFTDRVHRLRDLPHRRALRLAPRAATSPTHRQPRRGRTEPLADGGIAAYGGGVSARPFDRAPGGNVADCRAAAR
jgi:hypothetical protein